MSTAGSIKRDDSGKWFFVVDTAGHDGKRKQLKRRGFETKKAAQAELTALLETVQRGTFVRPTKMNVSEYMRAWLDGLPGAGRRPSTVASYRMNVEHNMIPLIGAVELQLLTPVDLDGLYSKLLATGVTKANGTSRPLSMRTVRYVHTIARKALGDAERKGLVARNVARLSTPPSSSSTRAPEMKIWQPAQLRSFLAGIQESAYYPMLRTASMSGLRRGELCGLRWEDVDLDAGTVSIRHSVTSIGGKVVAGDVKTKRSRRVLDVDAATVSVLRSWRTAQLEQRLLMGSGWQQTGLVFTVPTGDGWRPDTVSHAFDRLVALSGLPRIRLHDLRHTHASHLLAAGVNVKVVSERLGHASVAFTLDTYAHTMPGQQANAAAAVAAMVDAG